MKTLYCINQNDNMNNLLAINHYSPDKIIMIKNTKSNESTLEHFIHYLKDEGFKVPVETMDLSNSHDATQFLEIQNTKDSIFILPSNSTVVGYQLMITLLSSKIPMAYVEDDGDLFQLKGNEFEYIADSADVEVEAYIASRGGVVTSDTTDLFNHKRIQELLDYILDNFKAYLSLFRTASRKTPFYKGYPDNKNKMILSPNVLKPEDKKFLNQLLQFMEKKEIIRIQQRLKSRIIISFKHKSYKSYLLKTGTWLEHYLYLLFREAGVEQVEASLSFLWDKKRKATNEIDVIGVHNGCLIVASCKDRKHIDPEYINEVYTNAIHLGNHDAVKILFTTADITFGLQEKADEFGVHLITFNSNKEETIKTLKRLIS